MKYTPKQQKNLKKFARELEKVTQPAKAGNALMDEVERVSLLIKAVPKNTLNKAQLAALKRALAQFEKAADAIEFAYMHLGDVENDIEERLYAADHGIEHFAF